MAELAIGTVLGLSVVAYVSLLLISPRLHVGLDRLHSEGLLKRAPYRLARWGRVKITGVVYLLGLGAKEIPSPSILKLVRQAKALALIYLLSAIAGLGGFFAFIVYPAISRAS